MSKKFEVGSTKAPDAADEGLLQEFIQDRRATATQPPARVPVADLAGNPDNNRALGDIEELGRSLRQHGVNQPVKVMSRQAFLALHPHHEKAVEGASWVVINGNRRLAAARWAGLEELPVYVGQSPEEVSGVRTAVLVENIHRKNMEPLEEAHAIQELCEMTGWSQNEVARQLGKTKGWVSQRLALLNLIPELQEELRSGALPLKEARSIGRLRSQEQRAARARGKTVDASPAERSGDPDGVYPVNAEESAAPKNSPDPTPAPASAPTKKPSRVPSAKGRGQQLTLELEWTQPEETADQLLHQLGSDRFAKLTEAMVSRLQ